MWYVGNYWYNIYNKNAGKLSGGANFAFTNATMQLVIGCAYAIFLWLAPDARKQPTLTLGQFMSLAPLGFFAAVAHGGAVYAMSAGAVSFGQIVKAGEPVFAAAVGYFVYKKSESVPKLICLLPVIGGIAIASMQELDFTMASLIAASTVNGTKHGVVTLIAASTLRHEFPRNRPAPRKDWTWLKKRPR